MEMYADIIVASAVCLFIFAGICIIRGLALLPVKAGKDSVITMVLSSKGNGGGLEQTLSGLLWLCEAEKIQADIVIDDRGLDEEGKKIARILMKKNEKVRLIRDGKMDDYFEEGTWTN